LHLVNLNYEAVFKQCFVRYVLKISFNFQWWKNCNKLVNIGQS